MLFSCSAGQRAFEHDSLKHGVFFHHVLLGLRKEAADKQGRVTFSGLATYVSDQVPDHVHKLFPDQKPDQSPNLKADLAGKAPVLLTLKPAATPAGSDEKTGDEAHAKEDSKKPKTAAYTGTWLGLDWSFAAFTAIGTDIKGNHDEDKNEMQWIVVASKDIAAIKVFSGDYEAHFYDADDIRVKEEGISFTPNESVKRGQKVRATMTLPRENILKKTKKVVIVKAGDDRRAKEDSKKKPKTATYTGTWLDLDWSFAAFAALGTDIKGSHDEDNKEIRWILVASKNIEQINIFGAGYAAHFYDADDVRVKEVPITFTPNHNVKRGQNVRATLTLPEESTLKKTKKVVIIKTSK